MSLVLLLRGKEQRIVIGCIGKLEEHRIVICHFGNWLRGIELPWVLLVRVRLHRIGLICNELRSIELSLVLLVIG